MTPQLAAIGIVTTDMPRSLAFYRRLGLDIPDAADGEDHVGCTLPSGLELMWDTPALMQSFDSNWAPPSGPARVALGFRCADPADVDRVYADLTGAGYTGHLAPFDAFWGQRYASLRDPDGGNVDLYAELPEDPT